MFKSKLFKFLIKPFLSFRVYFQFKKQVEQLDSETNTFMFFPRYTVGGAERVHIDILKSITNLKPVCFIEEYEGEKGFFEEFSKYATLVFLDKVKTYSIAKRMSRRLIAAIINSKSNPVVFGCNSSFYYRLIPLLKGHVRVLDLLHAFSDKGQGAENLSLPVVHRINQRVVLGDYTKQQFVRLYADHHISPELVDRISIIANAVPIPEHLPEKNIRQPLSILYVGRKGYEKRLNIFNAIAKECFDGRIHAQFSVVGDMLDNRDKLCGEIIWHPSVKLLGEISDANKLNNIYDKADLILITSYREGFPMVIMEGMAHGVVPISTNVGELRWHIKEENKNGVLISALDETEIIESFVKQIKAFEADRDLLKTYSSNAYLYAKTHFSEEKFEQNYQNLFRGKPVL